MEVILGLYWGYIGVILGRREMFPVPCQWENRPTLRQVLNDLAGRSNVQTTHHDCTWLMVNGYIRVILGLY